MIINSDSVIIEILNLLGGGLLILIALIGFELYLKYIENKDRHGL